MVRRKYLINLIALYGLINAINSANGELFSSEHVTVSISTRKFLHPWNLRASCVQEKMV